MTFTLDNLQVPVIKKAQKVTCKVVKHLNKGVVVSCEDGAYLGIILAKEAKDLERNGTDLSVGAKLEAELLDPVLLRDDEGYYIVSVTKLLQYTIWDEYMEKAKNDEVITVVPTEANLWGLLVDIYGIKGFLPLSQLAPVHYPRVEDGNQEKIFEALLDLVGKEFKVRIINVDEENKRLIFSEREALKEEREKILSELKVGNVYEGTISGISSYGLFVTIGGGLEGLVHVSEITYWHVHDINYFGKVGDKVKVKVIGYEDGKISFSMKQLREDPWKVIPKKFKVGDIIEGEVVRFVPYGAFMRLYEDINALIHLSEISDKPISNPAEVLKLGQKVKAKLILLDPKGRKAGATLKFGKKEKALTKKENKVETSENTKKEKVTVKKKEQ
jgi:small subunit ribosomal protein S1